PANPSYAGDLADTLINLGALHTAAARFPKALGCYEAANDLLSELKGTHPFVVRYRSTCAASDVNLADLYSKPRQLSKAERSAAEARALYTDLVRQRPELPEYLFQLSQALTNQFVALHLLNRPDEAEAACAESIKELERLCRQHGGVPEYQKALAGGL